MEDNIAAFGGCLHFEKLSGSQISLKNISFLNNLAIRGSHIFISYENYISNSFLFVKSTFEDDQNSIEALRNLEDEGIASDDYSIFVESVGECVMKFDKTNFVKTTFLSDEWTSDRPKQLVVTQKIPKFIYTKVQKDFNVSFDGCLFTMTNSKEQIKRFMNSKELFDSINKRIETKTSLFEPKPLFYFSSVEAKNSSLRISNSRFQDMIHLKELSLDFNSPFFFINDSTVILEKTTIQNIFTVSTIFNIDSSNIYVKETAISDLDSYGIINSKDVKNFKFFKSSIKNSKAISSSIWISGLDEENSNDYLRTIENSKFSDNRGFLGGAVHIEKNSALSTGTTSSGSTLRRALEARKTTVILSNDFWISESKFSKNIAVVGGAIYARDDFKLELSKSIFKKNWALFGGAASFLLTDISVDGETKWEGNDAEFQTYQYSGGFKMASGILVNGTLEAENNSTNLFFKFIENFSSYECSEYDYRKYDSGWIYEKSQEGIQKKVEKKIVESGCITFNLSLVYFTNSKINLNVAMLTSSILLDYYPGLGFFNKSISFAILLETPQTDESQSAKVMQLPTNTFDMINITLKRVNMTALESYGEESYTYENYKFFDQPKSSNKNAITKEDIEEILNKVEFEEAKTEMYWVMNISTISGRNFEYSLFPFRLIRNTCPDSYFFENEEGKCRKCWINQFSMQKSTNDTCFKCRKGGTCSNGFMVAEPGYWRTGPESDLIFECMNSACLGEKALVEKEKLVESEYYANLKPFDFSIFTIFGG